MMNTPQKFAVSHLKEEDFKKDGLRSYATYRDLGFAKATHGLLLQNQDPCMSRMNANHLF